MQAYPRPNGKPMEKGSQPAHRKHNVLCFRHDKKLPIEFVEQNKIIYLSHRPPPAIAW